MPFSEKIKVEVKKLAHFQCCRCQSLGVQVHHIIPRAKGGADSISNAAPLCPTCHDYFGDNPKLRKEIRQMRDAWYERCRKEDEAGTLKMEEINRSLVGLEKNIGRKFRLEIGSLRDQVESLRTEVVDLSREPRIAGDPVLAAKVRNIETHATAVSGLVMSGGITRVASVFRLPQCPNCKSTDVGMSGSIIFSNDPQRTPTEFRCNKCGFSWADP